MKKIIISCIALMLQLYVYSQVANPQRRFSKDINEREAWRHEEIEYIKNNADFIFEGVLDKTDEYPRVDKNGKVFGVESWYIKITKVFKGKLKPGTIELIRKTDRLPKKRFSEKQSESVFPADSVFIFFCKETKEYPYDTKYNIYPLDNKKILSDYNNNIVCTPSLFQLTIFEEKFNSLADIYRFISTLPHVKMPVITQRDTSFERVRGPSHPGTPHMMSQAMVDSLKAIRNAKLIHDADSMYKANLIRYQYEDSIERENKKKVNH
jgi:hypothetical protein